ncbi:MAG: magnesium transporter [Pseudomonadota bacterium]
MSEIEAEARDQADAPESPEALDAHRIGQILAATASGDRNRLADHLDDLHPADIADLLEQVSEDERSDILALWAGEGVGDVLSELDEHLREEVIDQIDPEALGEAVRELETDDVVDLVEDLEDDQKEVILDALEAHDRIAVQQALGYPEGSAGRLMQSNVVSAPEHWSVGEAIDFMRAHDDLPEQFYHVILVDPRMHPVANVTLGRILSSRRDVKLIDIVEDVFRTIPVTEPEDEVAYAFNQYHLISMVVVDEDGRLAGAITIDDAMTVMDQENEEDMLRLAGVSEEESLSDGVFGTVRARLPWLAVNLLTAIIASLVIAQFDEALSRVVALAVLMPIVASMGGNAGTQSLTVAVRALATKDLTSSNMMRVIRREAMVGLLNGLFFAVVMGIVGMVWFGLPMLGAVIAAAMVINLLCAGLAGILIPVVLERVRFDPALASGTFVTTVTDVVGFFAFLGLASIVLL